MLECRLFVPMMEYEICTRKLLFFILLNRTTDWLTENTYFYWIEQLTDWQKTYLGHYKLIINMVFYEIRRNLQKHYRMVNYNLCQIVLLRKFFSSLSNGKAPPPNLLDQKVKKWAILPYHNMVSLTKGLISL